MKDFERKLLATLIDAVRQEINRMSIDEACKKLNVLPIGLETIKKRNTWTLPEVARLIEKLDL